MKFRTIDGTRQVELISLDGRATLLVTDPRHAVQAPDVLARIRLRVIAVQQGGKPVKVLAPCTVAQLRQRGIELDQLRQVAA